MQIVTTSATAVDGPAAGEVLSCTGAAGAELYGYEVRPTWWQRILRRAPEIAIYRLHDGAWHHCPE
jgi:hypothetical protein